MLLLSYTKKSAITLTFSKPKLDCLILPHMVNSEHFLQNTSDLL